MLVEELVQGTDRDVTDKKECKTRMHGVDKMDVEGNPKQGKLENWKEDRFGWG